MCEVNYKLVDWPTLYVSSICYLVDHKMPDLIDLSLDNTLLYDKLHSIYLLIKVISPAMLLIPAVMVVKTLQGWSSTTAPTPAKIIPTLIGSVTVTMIKSLRCLSLAAATMVVFKGLDGAGRIAVTVVEGLRFGVWGKWGHVGRSPGHRRHAWHTCVQMREETILFNRRGQRMDISVTDNYKEIVRL